MSSGIYYTQHARERMAQRRVTESNVEEILRDHHITYTDRDGNLNFVGDLNGRRVRVVIVGDGTKGVRKIKTVIVN